MRRSALLRWFVSFLIALPISLVFAFPTLRRCLTIRYADDFTAFQHQQHTVYVSNDATPRQRAVLVRHLDVATQRIGRFWGSRQGRAVLIYCPTQAQYARYCSGGEGAGCSIGLPWGTSFLVLGPEGNSPDVMAHELCHDELFARLGWLTIKRQVPQWFNEGLALMVDYRFTSPTNDPAIRFADYDAEWRYRTRGLMAQHPQFVPTLPALETTRDFFYGNYGRVMLAYLAAGREVARWLATEKQPPLLPFVRQLAAGEAFDEVYKKAKPEQAVDKAGKSAKKGSAESG
ncbi:hypothetical protein FAES_3326 [Fibrella aestuarina BUZ 2]|uniref:DUF1570 domain-containing protein n=1 Tax=Fibrella aestuarina BUZ 2 TaxID=1166018 RepID=I0KB31_9BACT|nr:hypothetical protein [Fibrella aestuarina]CCH01334.1 hypothetical protein FAES_3326 [Fibrella aestuarina BUZ 2]